MFLAKSLKLNILLKRIITIWQEIGKTCGIFSKIWKFSSREDCGMCRSRKMLKNAYLEILDAKIGVDTEENEPSKVWWFGWKIGERFAIEPFSDPNHQTLEGSFSAVSKPNFATKYSFFSIFRDLPDLQTFAPLRTQKFADFHKSYKFLVIFPDVCKMLLKFHENLWFLV